MKEVRCVFMFAVLTLWMALPVGAQNAKRGITMSLVNESLASALRKVQQESDYKVSFVIEDVSLLPSRRFCKIKLQLKLQIMELPSAPSQEQLPMRMENL